MRLTFILALLIGASNVFAFENCISCHRQDQYWNNSDRCPRSDTYFSSGTAYYGSPYGCSFPRQHRHSFRGWQGNAFRQNRPTVVISPTIHIGGGNHHHGHR